MFVKGYKPFSFVKNLCKNIGKNISQNLGSKYSQKHFDHVKKSATDALKTHNKFTT